MQRDHYLPLKVIREHLDALERGEQVRACRPPAGPSGTRRRLPGTPGPGGRTAAPGSAGPSCWPPPRSARRELDEWESYGLIAPTADGGYDAEAVTVAKLVADLGRFGLEPRHLRAMKAAAEREAGLVEQVVAPLRRHRNPQTRAHAEATARELAALSVRLHAALGADRSAGPAALTRAESRLPKPAGHVLGLLCERARRCGCPGGNALQPTDRAPA